MIVNNIQSTIHTQTNTEIAAASACAISLLQQMLVTAAADSTLPTVTQQAIQNAIASTAIEIGKKGTTKDYLSKSLSALAGVGSLAVLLNKLFDLF